MVFVWSLPIYRQPVWLETFIDDGLRWAQVKIDRIISDSQMLAFWSNHPRIKLVSMFTVSIGVSVCWILLSYFSSWQTQRAAAAQKAEQKPSMLNTETAPSAWHFINGNTSALPEAPVQGVERYFFAGLFSDDSLPVKGQSIPCGFSKNVDDCTGPVSTPRYQTPFVDGSSTRNFSHLERTAPISFGTLRRNGLLDADGPPTKKLRSMSRKGNDVAIQVYDSPTRSREKARNLPGRVKEVKRQMEDVEACWVTDPNDRRVQHFIEYRMRE